MRALIFLSLFSLLSCCESTQDKQSMTVHIPSVWIAVTDSSLSLRQDTLYHGGHNFSGYLYSLNATNDTLLREPYLNGLREGVCRTWYENKQLQEERFYMAGVKEGVHKGWWENGKPQYRFGISNDAYEGTFNAWNREGRLIKAFHYKNGQEEGQQQLWYDDGKIKANYIIRKGRRYGLLGTKNCVNVSDSLFKK